MIIVCWAIGFGIVSMAVAKEPVGTTAPWPSSSPWPCQDGSRTGFRERCALSRHKNSGFPATLPA